MWQLGIFAGHSGAFCIQESNFFPERSARGVLIIACNDTSEVRGVLIIACNDMLEVCSSLLVMMSPLISLCHDF